MLQIKKLRELHVEMDQAVLAAYCWDRPATEEDRLKLNATKSRESGIKEKRKIMIRGKGSWGYNQRMVNYYSLELSNIRFKPGLSFSLYSKMLYRKTKHVIIHQKT